MQIDLRDQRGDVESELHVGVEDQLLGTVAGQRSAQPAVQLPTRLIRRTGSLGPTTRPPICQVRPAHSVLAQRPVVHEAVLLVLDDPDRVADGVREHDPGLGTVGSEDEVLHARADATQPQRRQDALEVFVAVLRDDSTRNGHESGQVHVLEPRLYVGPLAAIRVLPRLLRGQAQVLAHLRQVLSLHVVPERFGDCLANLERWHSAR
ncbi:hypothetical protein ABZY81_40955 [Streptomyces sp. NPDC006514]|uniref:hypothetical protein n=1 Tax=Streptomyces sp. NPDC006514 TaxID=3154308 RepID=UPI0033BE6049